MRNNDDAKRKMLNSKRVASAVSVSIEKPTKESVGVGVKEEDKNEMSTIRKKDAVMGPLGNIRTVLLLKREINDQKKRTSIKNTI